MGGIKCVETVTVLTGEDRTHYFDFTDDLQGETLTGTPTITDDGSTGDLTISSVAINAATFTNYDQETVAIGKAVTFKVSGASVGRLYTLKCLCETTGSETVGALGDYQKAR